jgi:DNA-binding Lrp family transcriptional regulator
MRIFIKTYLHKETSVVEMSERVRRYSKSDDELILANSLPTNELAERLGRSARAIIRRRYELRHPGKVRGIKNVAYANHPGLRDQQRAEYYAKGVPPQHRAMPPWSPLEDARILADDRPTDEALSHELGRTIRAIQVRRNRIKKRKEAE